MRWREPGVRKTMIDLASASCRVEFTPGATDQHAMASIFADSVREATATALHGDGTPWWQPSTNWVALTAYSLAGDSSLWETLEASPGRIRVRHRGLSGDFDRLSRVAQILSHLEAVEACKAIPWSHRLTIDFRPDNGVADWFVDEAERAFEHVLATEAPQAGSATLVAVSSGGANPIQVASGLARLFYLALGSGRS